MQETTYEGIVRSLTWHHLALLLAVIVGARIAATLARAALHGLADRSRPRGRLVALRLVPFARLAIWIAAVVAVVPIIVEPTLANLVALLAASALGLAFALKDYASSLVAGLVTVLENAYQPGDWIELDGTYGEVKHINLRATHLVTPDDTEVIIPHLRLWSSSVFNATSGQHSVLCVASFYLHPDHDAAAVRRQLTVVAETSELRLPDSATTVAVAEKPWGTHYRLKAYAKESRAQFAFITDLTVRGKAALREMEIRFAQAPAIEAANP